MKEIGFIGIGNMGGAMAKAVADRHFEKIAVYDHNKAAYDKFLKYSNISVCNTLEELIVQVKYIVLSVKPQFYQEVCKTIKNYLKEDQIVITVAPGYSIAMIKGLLGEKVKVIRTMPNTPALIGEGVTAYAYHENELSGEEIDVFLELFNSFGKTIRVDEKLMAAVVATSGSSPAYAYMFIEAMADAAVSFGMPRQMAYEMSAIAIKGACEMVLQTKKHPGELKDAVTSPGGTTIQAVAALEETGFRNSVIKGMQACYNKANQMSGE
ncbi:MAG: pyrroline-5-carboxylate reductase [Clostridia bacterium]|jgi:pyrroline-5-carboxylate reductase|nr:pyrroline-5-carboxylate reductase [Clostridia bacterium]